MARKLINRLTEDKDIADGLAGIVSLKDTQIKQISKYFAELTKKPKSTWQSKEIQEAIMQITNLDSSTNEAVVSTIFDIVRGSVREDVPYQQLFEDLASRKAVSKESVVKLVAFYESLVEFSDYYRLENLKNDSIDPPFLRFLSVVPMMVPVFEKIDYSADDCVNGIEGKFVTHVQRFLCTAYITDVSETKQVSFTLSEQGMKVLKNQLFVAEKQMEILKRSVNNG